MDGGIEELWLAIQRSGRRCQPLRLQLKPHGEWALRLQRRGSLPNSSFGNDSPPWAGCATKPLNNTNPRSPQIGQ